MIRRGQGGGGVTRDFFCVFQPCFSTVFFVFFQKVTAVHTVHYARVLLLLYLVGGVDVCDVCVDHAGTHCGMFPSASLSMLLTSMATYCMYSSRVAGHACALVFIGVQFRGGTMRVVDACMLVVVCFGILSLCQHPLPELSVVLYWWYLVVACFSPPNP